MLTSSMKEPEIEKMKAHVYPPRVRAPLTRAGYNGKVSSAANANVSGMYATDVKPMKQAVRRNNVLSSLRWYKV